MQFPGITSKSEFRIIETGTVDDDTPFVTIELAGDNADSTFKLSVEISLASHNALKMKTTVHNTGVEVGTGCTVYAQNLSGETGCVDRVVFNPWEESPKAYRWYAGLGIGNFGKLRVAEPDSKSSTEVQFKVVDATPSVGIREDFELLEKINTRNMLSRRKIDLSDAELPSDLQ